MNIEEIIARIGEIQNELKNDNADVDKLSEEFDKLVARKAELESEAKAKAEKRRALIQRLGNEGSASVATVTAHEEDGEMIERKQFMDYVLTGRVGDALKRANATGTSTNLGVMIPNHVQQEIIKALGKVRGRLYGKVKHTNLQGGVDYPIGEFDATFTRISESAVSDRQNAGGITGKVSFKYNIGEIRLARTLLQVVLSVPAFEAELANVIAEAYAKAMDAEIIKGDTTKMQMEGITKNTNVKTVELTATEFENWKQIQKKVFGVLPLALKSEPYEFVMSNATYEANIKTLADSNNRPVYNETFSPVDGALDCRFKGHPVTLVENDLLPDFDTAGNGDVFAVLWVPGKCYAINSNMQFNVTRYFDHETNQEVTKAIVINDGKVLRPDMIYLLKKKVASGN